MRYVFRPISFPLIFLWLHHYLSNRPTVAAAGVPKCCMWGSRCRSDAFFMRREICQSSVLSGVEVIIALKFTFLYLLMLRSVGYLILGRRFEHNLTISIRHSDLWCMGYLNLCYLTRNACLKSMVVLQQIGAGIKFIFLRLVQISCLEWEPNYHNCTGCSHLYIYIHFSIIFMFIIYLSIFFTSILPLSSIFTHFQSS